MHGWLSEFAGIAFEGSPLEESAMTQGIYYLCTLRDPERCDLN